MGRHEKLKISEQHQQVIDLFIKMRQANNKSPDTIQNEIQALRKLADHLGKKSFKNANENDMMSFFTPITHGNVRNQYGNVIIAFYRWLYKLDNNTRPENMRWFKHSSADSIKQKKNPDKKASFITTDEYKRILDSSRDKYGVWEALWETLYLSGGRISEIMNMNVSDVLINENGRVSIRLRKSKTIPRDVPLAEIPNHLIRWLNNHILNDNPRVSAQEFIRNKPETSLWVSLAHSRFGEQLNQDSVLTMFWKLRNNIKIKKNLTIHCFRKTRATIMFSQRSKDGGLIFDDKQMGQYFGWKPKTVAQRREEYDLRSDKDLQDQIFGTIQAEIQDYDTVKQDRDRLVKQAEKINDLESKMKIMMVHMQNLLDENDKKK